MKNIGEKRVVTPARSSITDKNLSNKYPSRLRAGHDFSAGEKIMALVLPLNGKV
jgi:hypothetical protein